MDISWHRFVTEDKCMPAGGIPRDGVFAPEWYPTLDCPEAFTTLVWVDKAEGIVNCPPGATMWTFNGKNPKPALSRESSQKVICDVSGRYTIARGWGLLCQNSLRLRPSLNKKAMDRAHQLLEKQDEEANTTGPQPRHPPHILLYMLDAVSRPAFYRSLKATRRSIEAVANQKDLGTRVFEFGRHHSVGGSSIRNLTPMLSGLLYSDMDAKKKQYQAWIFEEMRRSGYISINYHNACSRTNQTFGSVFNRHGPEHYFPYQMTDINWFFGLYCQLARHERSIDKVGRSCAKTTNDEECFPSPENNMGRVSCLGGRSRTTMMVEHYLDARAAHDGVPTFAFLHDYDLHIDNLVALNMYDEDKARILPMLAEADVLKDTVVIFLSDHGSQRKYVATTQGGLEYKLPFLYMFVPDAVLDNHHGWKDALEWNQQVLTSPRDVHETMIDLLGGRGMGDFDWWKAHGYDTKVGGSSLLQPLQYNRTCADAGIPETECICGGELMEDIDEGSSHWNLVLNQYLPYLVNHMNAELASHNLTSTVCRKLEGGSVLHAASHQISEKIKGYQVQFSVVSPRTEPMELLAVFGVGSKEMRGITIDTIIQTSRFARWVEHCKDDVTAASGNHHYCDCARPPLDGGWKSIRPQHPNR